MNHYHILGGATDVALLVQIRGAKSGVTNLALKALPGFTHEEAAKELQKGLAEKGLDAVVTVVSTLPQGTPPSKRDFLTGAVVGAAGATAAGFGLWWLWKHLLSRWLSR